MEEALLSGAALKALKQLRRLVLAGNPALGCRPGAAPGTCLQPGDWQVVLLRMRLLECTDRLELLDLQGTGGWLAGRLAGWLAGQLLPLLCRL